MAKAKTKKQSVRKQAVETDGAFFLKIVLYVIIGSQWVFLTDLNQTRQIPLPVGLAIGGLFALHDHFQIDRKIEFAILLIACLVGFWSQTGVLIAVLS